MRFSIIDSIEIGTVLRAAQRVALAAALATPLACSSAAVNDRDNPGEAPLELPETLRITVRNASDRVRYVDAFDWMRSASTQVVNFDAGYIPPPASSALYTNQPTCQRIKTGDGACGEHGDSASAARALAPGAEHSEEWDARVWERRSLEGDPNCSCMESVKAPAGPYLVSFGVSDSLNHIDPSYQCEPGDGSCVLFGDLVDPVQLEQPVTWPEQSEVLLVID